ncbi:MAG: hypothetical protein LBC90_09475 [Candidatus Adiutrix sp.]|jgi:hypothetical protein|nr:hypothetical protein [Candidatus Adiutrix sp.]
MKSKTPLLILALAALTVLVFACSRPTADPFETFTLALDRLVGPGQWSAQSHEVSSGDLTVKGLKIKLPPEAGWDEGASDLTMGSVVISKILPKSKLENILALADWRGQPETALAGAVRLKDLRLGGTRPGDEVEIKFEGLDMEGLKLAPAAPGAPAGKDGFLKALRLGSLNYRNLRFAFRGREAEAVVTVDSAAFRDLSLGEDIPDLLKNTLGDYVPAKEVAGLNFSSLKASGLKMDFIGWAPELPLKGDLSLAALEETDLKAFKSVGYIKLTDLKSSLTINEGRVFSLNLAGYSLKGLDAADYLDKIMAGLAAMKDDPEATQAIADQFTLADFFVSPIALEEAALTGLEMDLPGLALIKLAELKAAGPYRIGEIPASAKTQLKGLEINLSGDPKAGKDTPARDIHEFSQLLGRNTFSLEAEAESAYEAGTGRLTARLNRLAASGLFEMSFSQTWGGLTMDRLEKFKKIPLNALYLAALNPGELLGEASFNALNLKYTDRGLVDLAFDLSARKAGETGETLKQRNMAEMGLMLAIMGARYLKNIEDLSRPLLDFLKTPQSLEIDLKAEPPLSFAVIQALEADPMAIMDSLNITFSANGQAGSPLKFVTGPGSGLD